MKMNKDDVTQTSGGRREVIKYWEKRRIIFNLLIGAVTLPIYLLRTGISEGVGDTKYLAEYQVVLLFLGFFIILNICYSFVYVLEFLFGANDLSTPWRRTARFVIFVVGCLIGAVCAIAAARDIGGFEYSPPIGCLSVARSLRGDLALLRRSCEPTEGTGYYARVRLVHTQEAVMPFLF